MSDEATNDATGSPDATQPEPTRRTFFELASLLLGAVVGAGPVLIGLCSFFHPLGRGKKQQKPVYYQDEEGGGGSDGFIRIASVGALPPGSPPQRFAVIADKIDAWNFMPDQPIGAVYVEITKLAAGKSEIGPENVRVFNATCPHAGCSVSCDGNYYNCPCHNSSFELDGSKRVSESGRENPSPREMDSLEFDEARLKDGEIWIDFKNFYPGKEHKQAKL